MPSPTLRRRFTRHASVVKHDRHSHCTVPGCSRGVHHFGAALCGRHADRRQHNGDVNATAITTAELRTFAGYIDEGMRHFDRTPAYQVALKRCHELINFHAATSDGWARYLTERMLALRCKRGKAIEPVDVLLVVLCLYAFIEAHPQRVPSTDSYHVALCRAVARLGPLRGRRPQKAVAIGAGRYIASQLGQFSVLFLKHWGEMHRRQTLKQEREQRQLLDFTITPSPQERSECASQETHQ